MSYFHTHGQLFHLHITLIHLMLPLEKTKASRGTVPSVQRKRKVGSEEPQAATQRATVTSGLCRSCLWRPCPAEAWWQPESRTPEKIPAREYQCPEEKVACSAFGRQRTSQWKETSFTRLSTWRPHATNE